MGLISEDYKPVSDEELLQQIEYALRLFSTDDIISGAVARNGPFMKLPIRQALEVAEEALKNK